MGQIFRSVLMLSAAGAVLIAVLLLLKPVTRRVFGAGWQYYIWLAVLVVMLAPVHIALPGKAYVRLPRPPVQVAPLLEQEEEPGALQTAGAPAPQAAERQPAPAAKAQLDWGAVLAYVWLGGAVLFLTGGVVSYWRFCRMIRKNAAAAEPLAFAELRIPPRIRLMRTHMLTAPLLVGIFRPMLLLPDGVAEEEPLRFILLHELTHYKRRDLWYKWFAFFVQAVHWFNPLLYIAVRQMNEACEISCDLRVTRDMGEEEKKGYMNTIVALAAMRKQGGTIHV